MIRRALLALALLALVAVGTPALGGTAGADTHWPDADSATIHPGVQTVTGGGQCTSNFVFTDGGDIYLGQAAHCSGLGGQTATNGCETTSLPLDTEVEIQGATQPGVMVYNSWITMNEIGETDPNACAYNDFALVRVHPDDHDLVNPSVPALGGPTGLGGDTAAGDQVFTYGNSSLRLGLTVLSPKTGYSLGTSGDGWTQSVYTLTPGVPGDSGSGFMDANGEAIGTLSTLALAPLPASNGVGTLALELAYAQANTPLNPQLAPGTEPFVGLSGLLAG